MCNETSRGVKRSYSALRYAGVVTEAVSLTSLRDHQPAGHLSGLPGLSCLHRTPEVDIRCHPLEKLVGDVYAASE